MGTLAGPDAELVALCAGHLRHGGVVRRIDAGEGDLSGAGLEDARSAMYDTLEALAFIPATTPRGVVAKAGAVLEAVEYHAINHGPRSRRARGKHGGQRAAA